MPTTVIVLDVFAMSLWRQIHLTIHAQCCKAMKMMLAKTGHNGCLQIAIAVIMKYILLATGQDDITWL